MSTIAITQPYFFPYRVYFELVASVDCFVFLDDVQYIRRGWVNRNRITSKGNEPFYFTVPVRKSHQNEKINRIEIANNEWTENHLKSFEHCYGKKTVNHPLYHYYQTLKDKNNLCEMVCESVVKVGEQIGISTHYDFSSRHQSELKGQERILELCRIFKAKTYVNLPGGYKLYNEGIFRSYGIDLKFMKPVEKKLSILDELFSA
jgi:hypothetical protein